MSTTIFYIVSVYDTILYAIFIVRSKETKKQKKKKSQKYSKQSENRLWSQHWGKRKESIVRWFVEKVLSWEWKREWWWETRCNRGSGNNRSRKRKRLREESEVGWGWRSEWSWFQKQGEAYRKEWSVIRREDDVGGRAIVTSLPYCSQCLWCFSLSERRPTAMTRQITTV